MFGNYRHTLDTKGRLFIPSKLRDEIGGEFYVSKSKEDGCLTLYPAPEWERILERCKQLPTSKLRKLRFFFSNVIKCEADKQGRFLLPESFREFAGITQEAVFVGNVSVAEIWSAERYEEAERLFEESNTSIEDTMEEWDI